MRLDGRYEPLGTLAQALALIGVLVGWWRHRKDPAPKVAGEFRNVGRVESPRRTYR